MTQLQESKRGGICAAWWVWWAANVAFMLLGLVLGSQL